MAQSCPAPGSSATITSFPNTYYSGQQAVVNAGSSSIVIGAATYGTTPISTGDILLIIQVQGAQIDAANGSTYGDGVSGSGYLANPQLLAGNMEYVVAANNIPLAGGTLLLQSATVKSYKNAAFGADGQYTYQLIHVPSYYDLTIGGTLTVPAWDGATGGVLVLDVVNSLDMNGQTIDASGTGFRGGGGVAIFGGNDFNTDFTAMSPTDADLAINFGDHASKGEGIAGTPRLINSNNYGSLTKNTVEGYPNGSFAMGAPGNAGGGGVDFWPFFQNDNSGGGGGGNGGAGGKGGNSFSSNEPVGGNPGASFTQNSVSRLIMGGGGGAGDNNNETGSLPGGFSASGATGGGIVIVNARTIINTGTINVNGMAADSSQNYDGAGGGGAGGSVLLHAMNGHANVTVLANGGNGGINDGAYFGLFYAHGPGGGGGGGVIYTNGGLNPASSVNGGAPGRTQDDVLGITTFGAAAGATGVLNTSATIIPPLSCMLLPMQFLFVNGARNNKLATVSWKLANEHDIKHYTIGRSNNGTDFTPAGTVAYRYGNGNQYIFTDTAAGEGNTLYYQVRAQDIQGHYTLSKVIAIKAATTATALSISPHPASTTVIIRWIAAGSNPVLINLFDAAGHIVLSRRYQARSGTNELTLTKLEALPNGLYLVQAYDGIHYSNGKLLIHH